MKRHVLFWLLYLCALSSFAQEFNTYWISVPKPDSLSHIWFRQTYLTNSRAENAFVTIASTGYFKLYINECNVGIAVFYPPREPYSHHPVSMTFDVTRYLRNDTNVIAVLYSPSTPHLDHKQISVSFYGEYADGTPFTYNSDANWLCRQANSSLTVDGNEQIDGRLHNKTWGAACFDPALWIGAQQVTNTQLQSVTYCSGAYQAVKITKRRPYRFFNLLKDGVEYDFGESFHGLIRVTLREARKGQRMTVGDTEYICSGALDEQIFPRFRLNDYRRVTISGDERFKQELIVGIEAVEIAPVWFYHFYE